MFAAPFVIILSWFLGPIIWRLAKVFVISLIALGFLLWSASKLLRRLFVGRKA
jgi:hypothetical protein